MRKIISFCLPFCLISGFVWPAQAEEPKAAADAKSIFDGKTLEGWSPEGGGTWKVEEGLLVGRNQRSEAKHGHLFLKEPAGDFTISLEFKSLKGNSGLYFRTEKKGSLGILGFQAEIDPAVDVGGLYETGGRAWVSKPSADFVKTFFKPGEWNKMTVEAKGRDVTVWVNGVKTSERKNDSGRTEGYIALQLHGGQDVEVQFREMRLAKP